MRILYHHRLASKDGQYVHVEALVQALRELGHKVIVVGPAASEQSEFGGESRVVRWLKQRLPQALYELAELSYSLLAYRRLARAVRRHRPDFLYERYNLFLPSGVWCRRRFSLPLLLEVNAPLHHERGSHDGIALDALARWSERYTWRGADKVLCVTEVLAEYVRAAGVPASRIEVTPNGIDPAEFANAPSPKWAKQELGLNGRLVVGFAGFLRDWHGLEAVVELLATPPGRELHLLVVGDGPARQALLATAAERGVAARIHCTGIVGRDAIARHIAAFDIAVQPKALAYASPLKLFEYMALGKAIVAPLQPNIREILSHEQNALLFDTADPEGLAHAIGRLAADSELRHRLGAAARHALEQREFIWQRNGERVARIGARLRQNGGR